MIEPPPEVGLPRLFSGLRIVASSTLLSRVLGMVREMASGWLFGAGSTWDAFSIAFMIPNLSRRLFGEGALSATFLPVFARQLENDDSPGRPSAWQLASAVFALLAAGLSLLVIVGEVLLLVLAWSFAGPSDTQLMLGLTAVMLPYALLICLAAQVTAVLHAVGHFTWPALVPVVLNVCWIASIWLVDPWFEPDRVKQAYALAVCVIIAGALQVALQLPTLRRFGFRFDRRWHNVRPAVREIVRAILPVTLGLSITQINTALDRLLAWAMTQPADRSVGWLSAFGLEFPLQPGAVSALSYAERLYQFPLGVFGVALGTVLFPLLSRHAARGEIDRVRNDLSLGLRLVTVIGIPASAGLALVAVPLTRLLFQHGKFSADDTVRTAGTLFAYSAGVWAYCGIPILYRAFYAIGERRIPLNLGLAAVALDLTLNLSLIWPWAERGLAASTAISASIQVACLAWLIQARVGRLDWQRLASTGAKSLAATGAMSAVCLAALWMTPAGHGLLGEVISLCVPILLAVFTYSAAAHGLRIEEFRLLFKSDRTEGTEH
jgi:putative peptidoglycan lipid II flippase